MKKIHLLLSAAGLVALVGCLDQNPTETRTDANAFPAVAKWSAAMAPVAPSTVNGTLAGTQTLGFHMNVTFTINGAPGATYQWRIFRGNCATTTAAANVREAGLWLFATTQSYPDAILDATGKATITRDIAGALEAFERALVRDPGHAGALNNLAVIRATAKDPALRDPQRAVELAERLVHASDDPAPQALETLAAAYASMQRFAAAVVAERRALESARKTNDAALVARMEARLAEYEQSANAR